MYRRDFADDPTLCDRVFDLLETWIPALPVMRRRAASFGAWRWEDVSTPFVHERDRQVLSHVGVLELDLVCHGETRRVGGIHAVCTLAAERRKGLYRGLMEEALAHCDERYATVELSTENPEYYEPFGFRRVPEFRFVAHVDSSGGRPGFRRLDLSRPEDRAILDSALMRRAPVSRRLGVVREQAVFKFNLGGGGEVYYCEAMDLSCVWSRSPDGRLELLDVIAPELPRLDQILAHIPEPVQGVRFHFAPWDLVDEATPEPMRDDWLMVRGEFPYGENTGEDPRGMVPPLARH